MKLGLAQRLAVIGVTIAIGSSYGVVTRKDLLSSVSPNPSDFVTLFLLIFLTAALIDFLSSIPIFGLLIMGAATRSFGAVWGVILLDHSSSNPFPLFLITVFEVTASVMAGLASFRLIDLLDSRKAHEQFSLSGKRHLRAYLKLLGLALIIRFFSALFESASILGMLPFGLAS